MRRPAPVILVPLSHLLLALLVLSATASASTSSDALATGCSENASSLDSYEGSPVVEVGATFAVRGVTNRNPEDATIVVEPVEGPDANKIDVAVVDDWGTSGVWCAEVSVPEDVIPGNYTLSAGTGVDTDRVEIRVLPENSGYTTPDESSLRNRIRELRSQIDYLQDRNRNLTRSLRSLRRRNTELRNRIRDPRNASRNRSSNATGDPTSSNSEPEHGFGLALTALVASAVLFVRRAD